MPTPFDALPVEGLVQPPALPQPEGVPTFSAPKSRQEEYADFMRANPHVSHVPFEVWDREARGLQAEGATRMADERLAMLGFKPAGAEQQALTGDVPGGMTAQPMPELTQNVKAYNEAVTKGLEATGLPQVGKAVGGKIGELADISFGAKDDLMERVLSGFGQELPRSAVGMIPVVGPLAMTGDIAARKLAETGDPMQALTSAAINAGTLGLAKGAGSALGGAAEKFVTRQAANAIRPGEAAISAEIARQAMTSPIPKVAQAVGTAAGATAGSIGGQVIEGVDPTSPEAIANTLVNAAVFAGPEAISAVKNRNGLNRRASEVLSEWQREAQFEREARDAGQAAEAASAARKMGQQTYGTQAEARQAAEFQRLIEESASIPDKNPEQWRKETFAQNIRDIRDITDPIARKVEAARAARFWMESGSVEKIADSGERTAMMLYAAPPKTLPEMADFMRRGNILVSDAMRLIDEKAAETGTSSAAITQLQQQKYLPTFNYDWLQETLGDGLEHSLSNNYATAWQVATNKLAAEILIHTQEALRIRGEELTRKSIEAPQSSEKVIKNERIMTDMMEKLAMVPEQYGLAEVRDPQTQEIKQDSLIGRIAERLKHHAQNDNLYDTGEEVKFAGLVSELIDNLTTGKTPDELAVMDWENTPALVTRERRKPAAGDPTKEQRVQTFEEMTLGRLLEQNFEGKYKVKISGHSTRSQREVPFADTSITQKVPLEQSEDVFSDEGTQQQAGLDVEKASALENIPTSEAVTPIAEVDWGQGAERVRQYLLDTPSEKMWDVMAPAFMAPGKLKVHGKTETKMRPVIKDLVNVVFSAGLTKGGEKIAHNEAADRIMLAWDLKPVQGQTSTTRVLQSLLSTFKQSGRDVNDFTDAMVRILVKQANVEMPTVTPPQASGLQKGVKGGQTYVQPGQPDLAVQNTVVGAYKTLRDAFLRQGYNLNEAQGMIGPLVEFLTKVNTGELVIGKTSAELGKLVGGVYAAKSEQFPVPSIGLTLPERETTLTEQAYSSSRVVSTLLHEYLHHLDAMLKGDTVKPATGGIDWESLMLFQRAKAYVAGAKKLSLELNARRVVELAFHQDVRLVDGKLHPDLEKRVQYAMSHPDEYLSVVGEMLGLGMVTNKTGRKIDVADLLTGTDEELAMFYKGVSRNLYDNLSAVQTYLSATEQQVKTHAAGGSFEDLPNLIKTFGTIFKSREPGYSIAQLRRLLDGLEAGSGPGEPIEITATPQEVEAMMGGQGRWAAPKQEIKAASKAVQDELFGGTPQSSGKFYRDALDEVTNATELDMRESEGQMSLFPADREVRKATSPGLFYKWLGLFQQSLDHMSRQGVPLMHDAIASIMQLIPDENRMVLNQRAAFSHTNGKLNKNLPAFKMRQSKSLADRQNVNLLNKLFDWAQENEASPFQQNDKGQWYLKEEVIQSGIGDVDGHVNPDVVDTYLRSMESNQVTGQLLVDSRIDSLAFRTSLLVMKGYEKNLPWDVAYQASTRLVRGMVIGNQVLSQEGLNMLPSDSAKLALSFLNDGMAEQVKELNEMIVARAPWFATRQRRGEYFITSYDKEGVKHSDSVKTKAGAERAIKELKDRGFTVDELRTRGEVEEANKFDSPETIAIKYEQLEAAYMDKWLTQNPLGLDAQTLDVIRQYAPKPGTALKGVLERRGTGKFLVKRKNVPSALGLDYLSNMFETQNALASTIARRALQHKIELILTDSRLADQPLIAQHVRSNLQAMLVPSGRLEQSAKTFVSANYIAANVSSMIVNLADPVTTLPVQLIRTGKGDQGIASSYASVATGMKDALWFHTASMKEIDQLALSGRQKTDKGQWPTRQEYKAMVFQKGLGLKVLDKGLMHDITESEDLRQLSARMIGVTKYDQSASDLALDPVYRLLRHAMILPRLSHQFNNHVAMFAGADQAYDAKMPVDAGFQHADVVRTQAMFAGGRTNAPGYIGKMGDMAPAGRVLHSMAQYSVGIMGMWYNTMRDAVKMDPNIQPEDRQRAWKALSALFVSTMVTAGLRGLPGVAALMAWLYKNGETDLESKARLGLYELSGKVSDKTGVRQTLTEVAMNGVPNQVFGVNIGPRVGNPDFLGVSSYDGFNIADASASFSLVKNYFDGLGYFVSGQPQRAVTSLAPNALRRTVTMAMNKTQYGDYQFRNPATNEPMYNPTTMDLVKYNMGFEPSGASESRKMRELVKRTTDEHKKKEDRVITEAANQLNRGNAQPAIQWVKEQLQLDPTLALGDPMHPVTRVTEKAVQLKNIMDPMAPVPLAVAKQAQAVQSTFPQQAGQVTPPVELEKQRLRLEGLVGGVQGDPADRILNAQIMQALQQKGKTPAEGRQVLKVLND